MMLLLLSFHVLRGIKNVVINMELFEYTLLLVKLIIPLLLSKSIINENISCLQQDFEDSSSFGTLILHHRKEEQS